MDWQAGRFTRVERVGQPPSDFEPAEIFQALLTPGLLNAHAHLNYSAKLDLPRGSFARWLAALIQQRRAGEFSAGTEMKDTAGPALQMLLADGVTEIWDIASFPSGRTAMLEHQTPGISLLEFIAPAAKNAADRWTEWQASWAEHHAMCRPPLRPGASPHALYSVASAYWERIGKWARTKGIPLALHLAESPEEMDLFLTGTGALAETLEMAGVGPAWIEAGPSPITRAFQAGLLGPATLAIHCNLQQPGEPELLARNGAAVVCCPRSHAWFAYPPYPLNEYRAAGVRLALGTDSLASNERLSIRAELRHAIDRWPGAADWRPEALLGWATGALLGDADPYGDRGLLAVGQPAQWALWTIPEPEKTIKAESMFKLWLEGECIGSSALTVPLPFH